jgi:oligopeptidase B
MLNEGASPPSTVVPPVARRVPTTSLLHGDRREDDYQWLRDKDSAEVRTHLEAENAYAEAMLRPTAALRETLYAEMLGRIKEDDETVPYRLGGHWYYSRTETGKQYPIMCRKTGRLDAAEEVTLDLNRLAEGHPFFSLAAYVVSDDGHRLAYTTDVTGFREYTLAIKDLRSGTLEPDRIERVASVAWSAEPDVLFYVVEDEAKRPYRMYRHRLGSADDELVYEERDPLFRLEVTRSRSRAYLLAVAASFTATEVRVLPAGAPAGAWRVLRPRERDHEYEVGHAAGFFYIRTNGGGRRNFRLVRAPVDDPREESWVELISHRDDVMLEHVDVFARHLVIHERAAGLPRLRVCGLEARHFRTVDWPEPAFEVWSEPNPEFVSTTYRARYESLVTPPSVYEWDLDSGALALLKRTPVLGGFDPARYRSERIHATAADGTTIPISLVSRADAPRDGTGPLLLAGYGAYGIPFPVMFASNRLSLLDRGVAFAIAHVRGGGELGKRWHDQGRMLAKRNSFADLIVVAEHLIAAGYTSSDRLAVEGGSAGGLLVGAVLNARPELFRAAVLRVPFVDVISTMLDESLPLTVGEFEEWGNPKEREQYEYMKTYCPYTNLRRQRYPALLVRTALNDSQVMYWEPAKYVARLRALTTGDPVLFVVNMAAGHGGASGRYDHLREVALDYAFVLTRLGVEGSAGG